MRLTSQLLNLQPSHNGKVKSALLRVSAYGLGREWALECCQEFRHFCLAFASRCIEQAHLAGRDRTGLTRRLLRPERLRGVQGVLGEATLAPTAQDPALARRLRDASVAATGIDPGLAAVR